MVIQKQLQFLKIEKIQLLAIYSLAILLPILLPKPQLLLGILINSLLIYSISKFEIRKILPLVVLPSLISYLNGLLFGSATMFLLYLVPFISLSNFALIYLYEKIQIKYVNIVIAASTKSLILYSSALLLTKVISLPVVFLQSMGIIQLLTALMGGAIVTLLFNKKEEKLPL